MLVGGEILERAHSHFFLGEGTEDRRGFGGLGLETRVPVTAVVRPIDPVLQCVGVCRLSSGGSYGG